MTAIRVFLSNSMRCKYSQRWFVLIVIGTSLNLLLAIGCHANPTSRAVYLNGLYWIQSDEIITYREKVQTPNGLIGFLKWKSADGSKMGTLQKWQDIPTNVYPIMLAENPRHPGLFIRIEGDSKEMMFVEDINTGLKRLVISGPELPDWNPDDISGFIPRRNGYTFANIHWLPDGKYILFSTLYHTYVLDPYWLDCGKMKSRYSIIECGFQPNIDRMTVFGYPINLSILRDRSLFESDHLEDHTRVFILSRLFECYPDTSNYLFQKEPLTEEETFKEKMQFINRDEQVQVLKKRNFQEQ